MEDEIIEILKRVIGNKERMVEIEEALKKLPTGKAMVIEIGNSDGDLTIIIRKGW